MHILNSTMEQQVKFITTKRGARSLVINGYQYTLNRRGREGQSYWRCTNRLCKGRAVISEEDEVMSVNNPHDHEHREVRELAEREKIKEDTGEV